jgi:hypothetical protein
MRKISLLVAVALSVLVSPLAQTAMYKWVDEDGNVTYSQKKPPAGADVEEIKKHGGSVTAEEAEGELQSLRDKVKYRQEDRDIKDDIAEQQAERSATIKKNCEIARNNKSLLETTARVTVKDEDGNDYFLEEGDRQNKLLDAQAQIDRYCD